jgi:hypothetical protein
LLDRGLEAVLNVHRDPLLQETHGNQQTPPAVSLQNHPFHPRERPEPDSHVLARRKARFHGQRQLCKEQLTKLSEFETEAILVVHPKGLGHMIR